VTRFTKITETLRHAGRQVCLIEVSEPRRVIFANRTVKRPLRLGQSDTAGAGIITGRVPVRLHDQALSEQGPRTAADGSGPAGSRKVDCLIRPSKIERLMRLRSQDFRC
jgi:hypothetical protein